MVRLANVLRDTLLPFICGIALMLAGWRINNEPFRDQRVPIVGGILVCAIGSVVGVWQQRRSMERDLLPRKARLEALLKELDAP